MTIEEIKNTIETAPEYEFLKTNSNLGRNLILVGMGGSHAYGLDRPTSDIDLRGIATNSRRNILTGNDFDNVQDNATDTTMYSVEKMFHLLYQSNPNVIEILGLKPEHYLKLTDAGKLLLDNKDLFLSRLAIGAFGGYVKDQIRRAECKQIAEVEQARLEQHIHNSMECAMDHFRTRYGPSAGPMKLYIDDAVSEGMIKEIFFDANYKHVSLREFCTYYNELTNIAREYSKLDKRMRYAMTHDRICKHLSHTIRLMYMVLDILEKKQIVTYRENERDLLLAIKYDTEGRYVDANDQIMPEFYEIYNELEKRFDYAKANTDLPLHPDSDKVNELLMTINEEVVENDTNR